jgi:preprotein translocase subunit YajC
MSVIINIMLTIISGVIIMAIVFLMIIARHKRRKTIESQRLGNMIFRRNDKGGQVPHA